MEGDAVWPEEGGANNIIIGLVMATVKVTMGEELPQDPVVTDAVGAHKIERGRKLVRLQRVSQPPHSISHHIKVCL